jgi:polyhydroxyalkanoate synthesis regulator phasin
MSNTNGIYYLYFENGIRKGTTNKSKAYKMTKEFAEKIKDTLMFKGNIQLAIV